MTDTPLPHVHNNAQPAHSTCPSRLQSSVHLSSTLPKDTLATLLQYPLILFEEYELTSQSNILRNNLQVLRPPQLRRQRTTPLHNLLSKLFVPLVAPVIVVATATENDAAAKGARKYVCGGWVNAFGRTNVPMYHRIWLARNDERD
jgi:hypothetical protein